GGDEHESIDSPTLLLMPPDMDFELDHYLDHYESSVPRYLFSPFKQDVPLPTVSGAVDDDVPNSLPLRGQNLPNNSSHMSTPSGEPTMGSLGMSAGTFVSCTNFKLAEARAPTLAPTDPGPGSLISSAPLDPFYCSPTLFSPSSTVVDGCIDPALTMMKPPHEVAISPSITLSNNSAKRLCTRYAAASLPAPGPGLTAQELSFLVGLLETIDSAHPSNTWERGSHHVGSPNTGHTTVPRSLPDPFPPMMPTPPSESLGPSPRSPRPPSHHPRKPAILGTGSYRLASSSRRTRDPETEYIIQQHLHPDSPCKRLPKTKLKRHWDESCKSNPNRLESKKWQCEVCGTWFLRKEFLSRHEENYLGSCVAGEK
ncbi:hypothetical protein FRB99_007887, partial [Tulasnella sp. 403]